MQKLAAGAMNRETDITAPTNAVDHGRAMVLDAIQTLDVALALWDEDLGYVFANDLWFEMFLPHRRIEPGDCAIELLKRQVAEGVYVLPEAMTDDAFVEQVTAFLKGYAKDVPIELTNGTVVTASVHQTRLGGYLVSFRDFSEQIRSQREAELQRDKTARANVRLRDALESIGEGFALFDNQDRLILANDLYKRANPAAAHLMTSGRPRKEIIEAMTNGGDIIGVQDWIDSYDRESEAGDTASPRRYEVHHADGRVFMASRGRTAEGGCTITWLDITDSKKTEARARAIANDAMESLDEGFALFDAELRFVFCNRMFADIVLGGQENTPNPGSDFADHMGKFYDRKLSVDAATTPRLQYLEDARTFVTNYQKRAEFEFLDGRVLQMSSHQTELGGFLITARDVTTQIRAHREIEQQRAAAEQANVRLRDALESIGEGFAFFDGEGRLIMVNQAYKDANPSVADLMTPGRPRDEITDAMWEAGDIKGYGDWIETDSSQSLVGSPSSPGRFEVYHSDGRVFLASHARTAEGGRTVTWLDITDTKKTEARARAIANDAMEALDEGFELFDADLRFVFCNRMFADIVMGGQDNVPKPGTDFEDHIGRSYDLKLSADAQKMTRREYIDEVRTFVTSYKKRVEYEFEDGRTLQMSSHQTDLGGYLITARDITDERAAQRAERDADHLVRTFVESSLTTFIVSRMDTGEVIYCPPHMQNRLHGLKSTSDFFLTEDDRQQYLEALSKTGSMTDYPVTLRDTNGEVFQALSSARVIDYKGENVIVSSTRDITEQLAMEAELQRQRETAHQNEKLSAMGELLAGVAHELNNPLSIVVGYAMMMQNSVADAKLRRQVDNVAQAAERCSRIVKAFLAMARQRPAELKRCSLNELMMAAVDMIGHRLRGAGIEVTMELDPDLPDVEADEDQIIQVFTNLLVNAEQALSNHPEPRRLHLRSFLDHSAGKAVARVADNGPGIDPDDMPRIFEPFYTTKDVGTGTGIGLAFCHRVVTSHGGRMTVRSTPGNGARFYVRLGLCDTDYEVANAVVSSKRDVSGTVLVVDDEVGVAQLIGDILGDAGYEVHIENTASHALEVLKSRRFDVIVSDIKMPGLDGPAFFDSLSEIEPELARRVGFVTGDTLSKSVATFLSQTEQPHLEKPVTPAELLHLVAGLMEKRSN